MPVRSLVVQVVACDRTEDMVRAYRGADPRADVVELRLDLVKDLDPGPLLGAQGKPKLVTVRSRAQGGAARDADRGALLRRALESGVEYVDLEYGGDDARLLKGPGRARRILSYHDPAGTPVDLPDLFARMRSVAGGALVKIVTFADAASDNLRHRDLLRSVPRGELIAFCMGAKGIPSRILAPHWGSAAVYAPLRHAAASAPGQVPLEDLFELYRFDRIDAATRLLGVLGSPVAHSLSPLMHNRALAARGINGVYLPFEAATVAEFLPLLSELRIGGLSVTLPHKEAILPHLDGLDETVRRVGAANTVVKTWNRLEGFNTDVEAALAPLRGRIDLKGARVAILGAGGAARALVYALSREGARVTIFNRTARRGRELAREFAARSLPWGRARRFRCDLLINATSVGLAPHHERLPVPPSWIAAPLVYDVIYNPPETRFLEAARTRGAEVIGGVDMFVAQGAAQFRLFTGQEPPLDLMRRTVLDALGGIGAQEAGPARRGRARSSSAARGPAGRLARKAPRPRRPQAR